MIHSLHQSLRDLSSDPMKTLENLSAISQDSQKQGTVLDCVERQLQQIERELSVRKHQDHLVSHQLQGALKKLEAKHSEAEYIIKNSHITLLHRSHHEDEKSEKQLRAEHTSCEKCDLEKQIQHLRLQVNQNIMISEVEELKSSIDHKKCEKVQLLSHIGIL
uniref:Uncharacterized protein n=1 Tax=Erpetoichthys calabaricus TaxID=27687 RepID=A0A8C4RIN8_ERPCA